MPLDDPIKIARLKIVNRSSRRAGCRSPTTSTGFLAISAAAAHRSSSPRLDHEPRALLARNPWSADFQVAWPSWIWAAGSKAAAAIGRSSSAAMDRCAEPRGAFLGRIAAPGSFEPRRRRARSLRRAASDARACSPGEQTEVVLLLGQESSQEAAARWSSATAAPISMPCLKEVTDFWDRTLGAVQVKTPDRVPGCAGQRLAALPNAGLPVVGAHRVLSVERRVGISRPIAGRRWRCAIARPDVTREHILRAASRQFTAGDVQHWWLPVSGQGIKDPHLRRSGLAALRGRALSRGDRGSRAARRAGRLI